MGIQVLQLIFSAVLDGDATSRGDVRHTRATTG